MCGVDLTAQRSVEVVHVALISVVLGFNSSKGVAVSPRCWCHSSFDVCIFVVAFFDLHVLHCVIGVEALHILFHLGVVVHKLHRYWIPSQSVRCFHPKVGLLERMHVAQEGVDPRCCLCWQVLQHLGATVFQAVAKGFVPWTVVVHNQHDVDGNVEMPQVAIAPLELVGNLVHHIATICCLDLRQLYCGSLILSHVERMSTLHLEFDSLC